jgi:hypothetical protein
MGTVTGKALCVDSARSGDMRYLGEGHAKGKLVAIVE